jgi:hypothetical protein
MAHEVHRREDLLRDARALNPRVMLRVELDSQSVEVFAGFRGEALSVYFDEDPVYHFNSAGKLRRAFVGDRLIKAERGRLVTLEPMRTATETALLREEASVEFTRDLLLDMSRRLAGLREALAAGRFDVVGQEPADGDALPRFMAWLAELREPAVASSPRVE